MHTGLLWVMICIKCKATGDVLTVRGKKIQIPHVTLIYSVPKGDLHKLVSLKISSSSTSFNTYKLAPLVNIANLLALSFPNFSKQGEQKRGCSGAHHSAPKYKLKHIFS